MTANMTKKATLYYDTASSSTEAATVASAVVVDDVVVVVKSDRGHGGGQGQQRATPIVKQGGFNFDNKKPCLDFNPCKHGQCLPNNQTGEFMCECNVGYMGPFCDLMRHPCDFKPCENGICEIVGDLYYKVKLHFIYNISHSK